MAESDVHKEELPFDSPGSRLRRAREAAGLSLGDIAARTKIAERHLASIEQDRFADLASRTYAVGFARAYARAVGMDEREMAQAVRNELAAGEEVWEATQPAPFEPGDPARVPGSRIAWLAALGALAVVALILVYWRSFYAPAVSLPELTSEQEEEAAPATQAPPRAGPAAPPAAQGPVIFTALEPDIWVKFYDAQGKQLMQKQMAKGETYTVPAGADGPQIRTARPDALQITVGGRAVPKLADKAINVKDRPVSAAALLARGSSATAASGPAAGQPTSAPPLSQPVAAAAVSGPGPAMAAAQPAAEAPAPAAAPPEPSPAAGETSTVSN